ncbi:response regulator [Alteromonas sp. BL110]|uniref:response regulator n=1 Tax=Alteromonas sp. BL110 TaxID=1714845 RepID=UPI000E470CA0|nr:response regulator [Alteromonas sp. BL110]AXT37401.1 response regulator [Alteromonas sp. BL110]RKM80138.1 response regulator [Alteromonas sp. BL110]
MKLHLARNTKLLIAEDQVLAKSHMHYALEQLGFRNMDYVDRPSHALSALQEHTYDAIICSYNLRSEQGGYFLLEQLNDSHSLPLTSAFIFTSADTSAEVVHAIIELQPDEFIAKPFSVNELDRRLSRVLARKKALENVYSFMDKQDYEKALAEVEHFLLQPEHAEHFPLAMKIKGDLFIITERFQEALAFFESIINIQDFSWAQMGIAKCLLALNELDDAEREIIQLAMRPDSALEAYDLLAKLQIKQSSFDDALECIALACNISPHNIPRHQTAINLARITHDYESQFNSAKKVVRYAKNSIYDKPDIYLTAARAGVDFAMTAEPEHVNSIVKQTNDYLRQLKRAHPKAAVNDELTVIDARLHYLKDDTAKAQMLLSDFHTDHAQHHSSEALLDRAKALHEVGLKKESLAILDAIYSRQQESDDELNLMATYLKQEKEEKEAITLSPKTLNNTAVAQYKRGNLEQSYTTFAQAFQVMPKNPSIALNYLQAIIRARKANAPMLPDTVAAINKCRKTLETTALSEDQHARYQNVKNILKNQ